MRGGKGFISGRLSVESNEYLRLRAELGNNRTTVARGHKSQSPGRKFDGGIRWRSVRRQRVARKFCELAKGVNAMFSRNVRYGLRQLVRNRVFAVVAILTLALGIGMTAAMFSVVYAVLV